MLFGDRGVKRRFDVVEHRGAFPHVREARDVVLGKAECAELLFREAHGDARFRQAVLGLEIVLLGRDPPRPEALLTSEVVLGQRDPLPGREEGCGRVRQLAALEHRHHLAAADDVAQVLANLPNDPRYARHHVGHAVGVYRDFARQRDVGADPPGTCDRGRDVELAQLIAGEPDHRMRAVSVFFPSLGRLRGVGRPVHGPGVSGAPEHEARHDRGDQRDHSGRIDPSTLHGFPSCAESADDAGPAGPASQRAIRSISIAAFMPDATASM